MSRRRVFGASLLSSVNRRDIAMSRKPTYEELEQKVEELETGRSKKKQKKRRVMLI